MNFELFDSSSSENYPDYYDGTLECESYATKCQFHKKGTLLAVGCSDGKIYIWDFTTKSILRIIIAHVSPISSLNWIGNSLNLISGATDSTVCVWNVKTEFNSGEFTVCFPNEPSVVVNLNGSFRTLNEVFNVCAYTRSSEYLFCAIRNKISIFKTKTLEPFQTIFFKTSRRRATNVNQIEFTDDSLIICTGCRVELFKLNQIFNAKKSEPVAERIFEDKVNRNCWKTLCLSSDQSFICTSTIQNMIYIWNIKTGSLARILDRNNTYNSIIDLAWHPITTMITSVQVDGVISVWSKLKTEKWSSFHPSFKEIEKNIDYEESESEFDVEDQDKTVSQSNYIEDEKEEIDVLGIDINNNVEESFILTANTELPYIEYEDIDKNLLKNSTPVSNKDKNKPDTIHYHIDLSNSCDEKEVNDELSMIIDKGKKESQ